ncbi:MAG: hypothetical protein GWP91_17835, partial [Rhodobacterales bacterium]|nr:hypothetical protein [Rhodobacterales bacterium]
MNRDDVENVLRALNLSNDEARRARELFHSFDTLPEQTETDEIPREPTQETYVDFHDNDPANAKVSVAAFIDLDDLNN